MNFSTTEKDIENFFKNNHITGVNSIKIIKKNGESQGYGFAEFKSNEDA